MSELILHITTREAWNRAQRRKVYVTESLEAEGLIHFSTPKQVVEIANFVYRRQQNLVLLCVSADNLTAQLKYEALGASEAFPHLYGPLNLDAVTNVVEFPPRADGTFELPKIEAATQSPRGV